LCLIFFFLVHVLIALYELYSKRTDQTRQIAAW